MFVAYLIYWKEPQTKLKYNSEQNNDDEMKQLPLLCDVLMFHACRPTDNMSCVFIQHIFCTDIRKLKICMFVNLTKYLTDYVYESKPKDIFIA